MNEHQKAPKNKSYSSEVTVEEGERAVIFKISTTCVDRVGDVMVPQGMDATDYLKNPVAFWQHDYDEPVAKCVKLWRDDTSVYAKDVFPPRPDGYDGDWMPDKVFGLIKAGLVRGASVGFDTIPGGTRNATKADIEKYGPDARQVYSKWKIWEHSITPMPCNQEALALAVSKGMVSAADVKKYLGQEVEIEPSPAINMTWSTVEGVTEAEKSEKQAEIQVLEPETPEKTAETTPPPVPAKRVQLEVEQAPEPEKPAVLPRKVIVLDVSEPEIDVKQLAEDAVAKRRGRIYLA